jgi:hypothetical protein
MTFDPSGAATTAAESINYRGESVGYYTDGSGVYHGFQRRPDGRIRAFDPPGSIITFAFGIDSGTDSGGIAGSYADSSYVLHGFVRIP